MRAWAFGQHVMVYRQAGVLRTNAPETLLPDGRSLNQEPTKAGLARQFPEGVTNLSREVGTSGVSDEVNAVDRTAPTMWE
jgi:hypothetical protein